MLAAENLERERLRLLRRNPPAAAARRGAGRAGGRAMSPESVRSRKKLVGRRRGPGSTPAGSRSGCRSGRSRCARRRCSSGGGGCRRPASRSIASTPSAPSESPRVQRVLDLLPGGLARRLDQRNEVVAGAGRLVEGRAQRRRFLIPAVHRQRVTVETGALRGLSLPDLSTDTIWYSKVRPLERPRSVKSFAAIGSGVSLAKSRPGSLR